MLSALTAYEDRYLEIVRDMLCTRVLSKNYSGAAWGALCSGPGPTYRDKALGNSAGCSLHPGFSDENT